MLFYNMNGSSNVQRESNGNKDAGVHSSETTPLISAAAEAAACPARVVKDDDAKRSSSFSRVWSRLIFDWFTPLLERGNAKKRLDQEDLDLIPLPLDCQTVPVSAALELYWNQELQQNEKLDHHPPSLMRALFRAFGTDFVRAGLLKLVHDLCVFVGPQVLHAMILFLRSSENDAKSSILRGFSLMLAVTASQTAMSFCLRHYFFKCYTTGLRVRTAVVVAIYRKALLVSAGERNTRTVGEITNLMSIDAQRLQGM
jgi:ATP-binding cassette, subfamily C (CFTR/MRP), member 1